MKRNKSWVIKWITEIYLSEDVQVTWVEEQFIKYQSKNYN